MGEKSGGLTNMIIIIVALVAIVFIVHSTFPNIAEGITDKMQDVIDNTGSYVGMFLPPSLFL